MPTAKLLRSGVYCIFNKKNGKRYVGSSTVCLYRRIRSHKTHLRSGKHHNRYLQAAYRLYGESAFVFQILERCTPDLCLQNEQKYIDLYQSANNKKGYNLSPTAGNTTGYVFSEDIKEKIAASHRGKKMSDETRAKMSLAGRGRKKSKSHAQKISDSLKGKTKTQEHREKLAQSLRGKKLSEEHKASLKRAAARRRLLLQSQMLSSSSPH